MSIYVQSHQIISELRCHRNLLTSSKAVPLCLKQVLVVRTSLIQISGTWTSFLTILRFLCVILFIICHDLTLPCGIHSEWRISLRFFSGDFSLPCGIAFTAKSDLAVHVELKRFRWELNLAIGFFVDLVGFGEFVVKIAPVWHSLNYFTESLF